MANPKGDEQVDAVAFALRAEYEGHVEVELEDGSNETRPKFAGGLLAVGDGDFNVGDALEEGAGAIVVYAHDSRLVDLLDTYPALKRIGVPAGAEPINPYVRRTHDDLKLQASLRDLDGAGSLSKGRLANVLLAHDAELAAGVAPGEAADEALATATDDASAPTSGGDVLIPVDGLSTDELVAVIEHDVAAFEDAGRVELPAAIDELHERSASGDEAAAAAIEAHDLTKEG